MEIKPRDFKSSKTIELQNIPTTWNVEISRDEAKKKLKELSKKLAELQDKMYAHDKYSVLVCLQGMDTSGKDSLIREVFKNFNVRGVEVSSFKTPSYKELQHDFFWRHTVQLPEKGKFKVFNRTYYENVLISRVHPEIVLNENNPYIQSVDDITEEFWDNRMQRMVQYEKHLDENGTIVLKFFLNVSKEEQKKRLLKRLNEEKNQWKFSAGDLKERKLWDDYQFCYQEVLRKTSHKKAPWYIVPADNKDVARLIVATIIYKTLKDIKELKYPVSEESKQQIESYKQELLNEDK